VTSPGPGLGDPNRAAGGLSSGGGARSSPTALLASPGPGSGPCGVPAAIALSPILAARYRAADLEHIRSAAPGSRLVTISREGLADGPLDEVEVLLRGGLSSEAFDRVLARAPGLRWVHSALAGVERVITPAARDRGLVITNARGVFSRPIAEYVLMMILAISRRLPQLLELQRERTWQPLESRELQDLTIGIVGLGSLGREIVSLAAPFGPRILATRRRPDRGVGAVDGAAAGVEIGGPEQLGRLLSESDMLVLALPLLPETESIIDAAALGRMKPDAWLINVARGRLVDERALVRALRGGLLAGAVLDTFRDEPLPPASPLYDLPNVILTPHTSWSSSRVLDRSIELFCENLRAFARGDPLRNVVDPALGY